MRLVPIDQGEFLALQQQMQRLNILWVVTFNDGTKFEGDEVQCALVSGFTAKYRGGIKCLTQKDK